MDNSSKVIVDSGSNIATTGYASMDLFFHPDKGLVEFNVEVYVVKAYVGKGMIILFILEMISLTGVHCQSSEEEARVI